MTFINPAQLDIANAKAGEPAPVRDRRLTVEIWYPALTDRGRHHPGEYKDVITCDGTTRVSLYGRAIRDAVPDKRSGMWPLVIISHGYPGNRFLLSHLGENLASKGYVAVSIDHTDSTYSDIGAFSSTLFNRSLDQLFILDSMARLNFEDGVFAGLINADKTAIIGYSMGGYGVINTIGGGFTSAIVKSPLAPPDMLLAKRQAGNSEYEASIDSRVKAAIAIAPWGWIDGFWDKAGLEGVNTPIFFMAGSADIMVGYSPGVRDIFENCVNVDRYLLTFENAGHNAIAPIPAPKEVRLAPGPAARYWKHYADPVWDSVRTNNIAQHFTTAFLAKYLKDDNSADPYLNLVEYSMDGLWSTDDKERPKADHTYWKGFANGNAIGLRLEHRQS
jgi:predicted dienelactone hydrolase